MCRNCYEFEIYGHADLFGDWSGWRLRGRCLVTPDRIRIPREALKGLAIRWWLDGGHRCQHQTQSVELDKAAELHILPRGRKRA